MKKLLFILLLTIPLIFNSCKKEEVDNQLNNNNNVTNSQGLIGYGFGECDGLYKTNDGGENWSFVGPDSLVRGEIDFPSENIGYSVTDKPGLHITKDGGVTWDRIYQNIEFGGVIFPSNDVGYCYDEDER